MTTINAKEARGQFKQLLDRVAAGEKISIQRHGKTVARLVPPTPSKKRLPSLKKFRASIHVTGSPLSISLLQQRKSERF